MGYKVDCGGWVYIGEEWKLLLGGENGLIREGMCLVWCYDVDGVFSVMGVVFVMSCWEIGLMFCMWLLRSVWLVWSDGLIVDFGLCMCDGELDGELMDYYVWRLIWVCMCVVVWRVDFFFFMLLYLNLSILVILLL